MWSVLLLKLYHHDSWVTHNQKKKKTGWLWFSISFVFYFSWCLFFGATFNAIIHKKKVFAQFIGSLGFLHEFCRNIYEYTNTYASWLTTETKITTDDNEHWTTQARLYFNHRLPPPSPPPPQLNWQMNIKANWCNILYLYLFVFVANVCIIQQLEVRH